MVHEDIRAASGERALVVDDALEFRELVGSVLRKEGFDELPWVLVDWVEDDGPVLQTQAIDLPRVCVPRDRNWPSSVKQALRFA